MSSAENLSDERLAEMLLFARHCRHGEFAALVDQQDVSRALVQLQVLRSAPKAVNELLDVCNQMLGFSNSDYVPNSIFDRLELARDKVQIGISGGT